MSQNDNLEGRHSSIQKGKEGVTLVEVVVSVAILSFMSAAIYFAAAAVVQHAQSVTITTTAHLYAKEGLEEAIASGYETLRGGNPTEQTYTYAQNVQLIRTTTVVWHDSDGSVLDDPIEDGYAEVVVEVSWTVPRSEGAGSTAISTLLF